MSNSSEGLWSDNSNAPQIPPALYTKEKLVVAAYLLESIFYGVVVLLFFRCMSALLDPANRAERGIKWGLLAHTVTMFSIFSMAIALDLHLGSVYFVDCRKFPGTDELPPGPLGCADFISFRAASTIFSVSFPLNQWLADGFLLYRCYVIFSMNYVVIAFPCLIYFASIASGIAFIYEYSIPEAEPSTVVNLGTAYFSISLSLNLLLTLMIVTRLILHHMNLRSVIGGSDKTSGLYTALVTMIVESYALYAVAFLSYIVPWSMGSDLLYIFSSFVGGAQIIAPYLLILRVAERRALTSEMITGPQNVSSIRFESQETTNGNETLPDGEPTSLAEPNSEAPGEPL